MVKKSEKQREKESIKAINAETKHLGKVKEMWELLESISSLSSLSEEHKKEISSLAAKIAHGFKKPNEKFDNALVKIFRNANKYAERQTKKGFVGVSLQQAVTNKLLSDIQTLVSSSLSGNVERRFTTFFSEGGNGKRVAEKKAQKVTEHVKKLMSVDSQYNTHRSDERQLMESFSVLAMGKVDDAALRNSMLQMEVDFWMRSSEEGGYIDQCIDQEKNDYTKNLLTRIKQVANNEVGMLQIDTNIGEDRKNEMLSNLKELSRAVFDIQETPHPSLASSQTPKRYYAQIRQIDETLDSKLKGPAQDALNVPPREALTYRIIDRLKGRPRPHEIEPSRNTPGQRPTLPPGLGF